MGGMCECSVGESEGGGVIPPPPSHTHTHTPPVTPNGQREPRLFKYANSAAGEIYVRVFKCASRNVFVLGQMGKKTDIRRHANVLGRKRSR